MSPDELIQELRLCSLAKVRDYLEANYKAAQGGGAPAAFHNQLIIMARECRRTEAEGLVARSTMMQLEDRVTQLEAEVQRLQAKQSLLE